MTIKRQFHVRRGRSNRRRVLAGVKPSAQVGGVPKISRLMALAIRFDQLIRDGVVSDQAELLGAATSDVDEAATDVTRLNRGFAMSVYDWAKLADSRGNRRSCVGLYYSSTGRPKCATEGLELENPEPLFDPLNAFAK